jgi:hypothetical protein
MVLRRGSFFILLSKSEQSNFWFTNAKRIKVDVEGWAEEGREDRDILSRKSNPLGRGSICF